MSDVHFWKSHVAKGTKNIQNDLFRLLYKPRNREY